MDDSMVSIPRRIFGLHLAVLGCALLVLFGNRLGWYGREPVIVAFAFSLAVFVLIRPCFVLTADGLDFVARVFYILSIHYASIDRKRIRSIKVGWEREDVVGCTGGVAYSYRRPFLGIFLDYLWNDPPRETTMCIERIKHKEADVDMTVARKRAAEYARVLGCQVQIK